MDYDNIIIIIYSSSVITELHNNYLIIIQLFVWLSKDLK